MENACVSFEWKLEVRICGQMWMYTIRAPLGVNLLQRPSDAQQSFKLLCCVAAVGRSADCRPNTD